MNPNNNTSIGETMSNQSMTVKFLIAVVAQIIIVFLLVAYNAAIVTGGKTLYVSVLPVDPTDVLRGDYVVTRLSISQAYPTQFNGTPQNGETVYVPVKQISSDESYISGKVVKSVNDEGMGMDGLAHSVPDGTIYVKGTVVVGGAEQVPSPYDQYPAYDPYGRNVQPINYQPITIKYGVENIFVEKGKGNLPWNKRVVAELKVGSGGVARITKLFVDGVEWK